MKSLSYIFLLLVSFILVCCKNEKSVKQDCTLGKPTAIFTDSMEFIKQHTFNVKDQESAESLILPDDVTLQIDQAGCESISQRYTFTYPTQLKLDSISVAVDSVISKFNYLSTKNNKLKAFSLWSNALTQYKSQLHQNEQLELDNGIMISIDKMNSFNRTSLYFECLQKGLSEE
ncbi:MAG TPA: hypothetical protein VK590_03125 [Saprospiraceae bacterium]|nr:hypothetical protein [Saprospiraceae bacterium]